MACFAFLKRAFSASQQAKLSVVWERALGKESCLVALQGLYVPKLLGKLPARCGLSGAQASSPGGGQEPGMEILWSCRVLEGSSPCSDLGLAANGCQQTQATKGWLVPDLLPVFCGVPDPQESLDRIQFLSAHPLAQSGACQWSRSTLVPHICRRVFPTLREAFGRKGQGGGWRWDQAGS